MFSILSSFANADIERFFCMATEINGRPVSERTALAQGNFFTPTFRVDKYKAEMFLAEGERATDLRNSPLKLKFDDYHHDELTDALATTEYARYRGKLFETDFDLIIFMRDGEYLYDRALELYKIALFGKSPQEESAFVYDCYDEVSAFNKLDITYREL